ncbi:hypothetical protein KY327_01130 [Candidatus Woesearchaeota archaeon]|nr:hypothetical protein [Candidatus Woesearchaeota archaeon]
MRHAKTTALLLILSILCTGLVSASVNLDTTSIDATAKQGDDFNDKITITNQNETVNLTFTTTDLVSGADTIPASAFTVNPTSKDDLATGTSVDVALSTTIDAYQATGTYTGTLDINYDNGTVTGTEQADISITVQQTAKGTLTFSDLNLGDDDQERDEEITGTFTIKNEGILQVQDLNLTDTVDDDYEFTITPGSTTIPAGGSIDVSYSIKAPLDQDAGTERVGTVTATGTVGSDDLNTMRNVNLEVENNLIIDKVTMTVEGSSDSLDDGDTYDDEAKPGDDVEIEVRVENTFDDNMDIEDVEVIIESNGDLDWDKDEDLGDIEDDDKDTATFSFTVPEDADEDDYEIEIRVEGTDEEGARHGEEWTVELEVEKEDEDLRIDDVTVSPSFVRCGQGRLTIRVDYTNIGQDDLEDATIRIRSDSEIDYEEVIRDIEIDEGDDDTESATMSLPDDLPGGQYFVDVEIFTSGSEDDRTDVESASFTVEDCQTQDQDGTDDEDESTDEDDGMEIIPPPQTEIIDEGEGRRPGLLDREGDLYLALLIVIAVLLVVLIIVVGANAFKPARK